MNRTCSTRIKNQELSQAFEWKTENMWLRWFNQAFARFLHFRLWFHLQAKVNSWGVKIQMGIHSFPHWILIILHPYTPQGIYHVAHHWFGCLCRIKYHVSPAGLSLVMYTAWKMTSAGGFPPFYLRAQGTAETHPARSTNTVCSIFWTVHCYYRFKQMLGWAPWWGTGWWMDQRQMLLTV